MGLFSVFYWLLCFLLTVCLGSRVSWTELTSADLNGMVHSILCPLPLQQLQLQVASKPSTVTTVTSVSKLEFPELRPQKGATGFRNFEQPSSESRAFSKHLAFGIRAQCMDFSQFSISHHLNLRYHISIEEIVLFITN